MKKQKQNVKRKRILFAVSSSPLLFPLHEAQQTPIIYKADNKMLSKNTTRGARHGQPELNAARLRNAQQVEEGDEGRGGGRGRV